MRLVLGAALRVLAAGALVGLVVAIPATRLLSGFVVDVSLLDVTTYAAGLGILTVVAIAGVAAPALRASNAAPAAVMRDG